LALGVSVAQETTGALIGVVTDASEAAIPGVKVTVTEKSSGRVVETSTNEAGQYFARGLASGRYSLRFETPGFTTSEVPEVNLLVGKTLRVNVQMEVGAVEQTVEVTSAAPLIDTTGTAVAQNLRSDEFALLPKGRSFQSLAITSAFVNAGEIEGGIQVNGASGAENNFMVDGLSNTSLVNGKARQNAQMEYLQEVQVKTAGIEAEYGGALGGVITGITKSGGNEFHGEGHWYFFGSPLNAAPVKRLVLDPADDVTVGYFQDEKQKDRNNEAGGSIGGYFIPNKMFFYSAISPRWRRREINYLFSNGTEPGTLSNKSLYMSMFNKLSFDPISRVRTNFSWLYTPTYSTGSLAAYDSYANSLSSSLASNASRRERGWYGPQSGYVGTIDVTTTNTSLLSIRGGYFYDNYHDTGIPSVSSVTYQATAIGLPFEIPSALQGPVGTANVPRARRVGQDLVTRAYIQADQSVAFNALGSHNMKFGVGTQKTVNNIDDSYPGGGYVYIWWDKEYKSLLTGETGRGQYGYYEVNDVGTIGSTGAHITHLYIQDQWRIHPRVSLSLGLRTEKETIPSFRRDIKPFAFKFNYGDKMAPRIGTSIDVRGDGSWKIYGSWGRFYDWTKYELARGSFGGDTWRVFYRALDTTDVFSLSGTNLPGTDLWGGGAGGFRNRRSPGFNDIDPDIKPMSQDMFSAGTEYQLTARTVFTARYVHTKLNRTIEDIGSLVNGDEVYIYGNPGEGLGKEFFSTGLTPVSDNPKAKRIYNGLELSVNRRFGDRWFGSASYVYSRLYGNYAGLANSDEISSPTTNRSSATAQQSGGSIARPGSNVTRGWDLDELLFDGSGNKGVYGRLATDRPHVFKLYGSYSFKIGTEVGGFFYGGSGTPLSSVVQTLNGIPSMFNGRGDLGRTPFLTQTDLMVAHQFSLGEVKRLRLEFNMSNLFNQKTARHRYDSINRERRASSAVDLSGQDLTNGYDVNALLADATEGAALARAPQYNMEDIFNGGFAGRFLIKFIF
jgi:hypothetical protein